MDAIVGDVVGPVSPPHQDSTSFGTGFQWLIGDLPDTGGEDLINPLR